MKIHTSKSKKSFTLLELIVAMAVFSVLVTVLMSFFNSAQKVTLRAAERTEIFENARVAFELIERDLKSSFYPAGDKEREVKPKKGSFSSSLSFWTFSENAEFTGKLIPVIYKVADGELRVSIDNSTETIAKNIKSVKFYGEGGDEYMPDTIRIELISGKRKETQRTFTRTVYIGGRGQKKTL